MKVRIDEQPKGVWKTGTEPLDVQSPSGQHKLTVLSDGRKTFEQGRGRAARASAAVHVKMIPKYPRGAAWTQAVIGAAFIGAAAYFGNESNKIYDQLDADRKAGRLEQGDSRATKGRWYAVGADSGFVVGGVLGALATYNFIKDPLPESSIKSDKPVEFDDPRKGQPVALLPRRGLLHDALAERQPRASGPALSEPTQKPGIPTLEQVSVGALAPDAPGLFIGGKF